MHRLYGKILIITNKQQCIVINDWPVVNVSDTIGTIGILWKQCVTMPIHVLPTNAS